MDTLTFLQRVLPNEGVYVSAALLEGGAFRHGFVTSLDELGSQIDSLARRGNNTYYAIASYVEKGNRKRDNVHKIKVVALDIDCGEGKEYPNQKAGLVALMNFIKESRMPEPMIVSSGNGLHVYWVLTRALSVDDWLPLAEAVKAYTLNHGLMIDRAVTSDPARVLRPVGTINPKGDKPVKILIDRPDVTVETLSAAVAAYIPPKRTTRKSTLLDKIAVQVEYPNATASVVRAKCQQVAWAIENADDVSEPMWYTLMGVAAYCTEPESVAIEWSRGHSMFSETDTIAKLNQWRRSATGPATCTRFELERPDGCKGCAVKGRITTPARLGVQYEEVAPAQDVPKAPVIAQIELPKPFKRTKVGIKITIEDTDLDVCPFDIYPVGYGRDESLGYETVRYSWNRPHVGWSELVLRQAYLAEGSREFATSIADQGIVLYNKKQTEWFQLMLRTYMDSLRQMKGMTNLYATMGWKENFSEFVIGNTVFRRGKDGKVTEEEITLANTTNRLGNDLYDQQGNWQDWAQFTSVLDKADMPWHKFALGVGLSSVFYAYTGLKGLTVSLYGPTGGGKTLIQYWIQSIYGNPDRLHFSSKFTQNTLFSRMGTYSNMPLTIDEVTLMSDKDVADFIYWVSQGRDKARLTRTAEEREAKTWAMPVVVSTNRSFASKMASAGLDHDAQLMRLLEVTVPAHKMFTTGSKAGRMIYEFLMSHYGAVGREFIRRLMELGEPTIRTMVSEAATNLTSKYGCEFSGEERFWEQSIALADLALGLASDWGLIKFDHDSGIKWTLEQLGVNRRAIAENKADSFDILSEFLNDNADAAVTVMHTGSQKPMVDMSRMPRADIRVRFDVYRKNPSDMFDRGILLIDRTFLRRWLSGQGVDYKTFMQTIDDESALATPKSQKAYLGKDTPAKLGQSYVIGINLSHPRLVGILDAAETAAEDLVIGQIKAV